MSKREQYKDLWQRWDSFSLRDFPAFSAFVPFCEDCEKPVPDWSGDDDMRVQCDDCMSNNEG